VKKETKKINVAQKKGEEPWDGGLEGHLHSLCYRFTYNYKMDNSL